MWETISLTDVVSAASQQIQSALAGVQSSESDLSVIMEGTFINDDAPIPGIDDVLSDQQISGQTFKSAFVFLKKITL